MATITASGIGSGLDVESIVSQLMALERRPLNNMQSDAAVIEAQISAYGSLKSKIADFESAMDGLASESSFKLFSASSSDESVLTGSASSSAAAGTYEIEVTQLAERDKLRSSAFTDATTVVGEGTLTITVGSDSFNLDISAANNNNTVEGIRDAINSASNNTGVTASIVNDASGASLVISADDTGLANALTITVSGDTSGTDTDTLGLSALAYDPLATVGNGKNLTALTQAQDGEIEIDNALGNGFTINSSTNSFSSALDGVTINASKLGTSTLSISRDDDAIVSAVNNFTDAYNALKTEITNQRAGQLEADSTLLSIERQISDIFNAGTSITGSSFAYLSEIGITTDDFGKLTIDSDELNAAIDGDFDSFVNLFSAEDEGYAARLSSIADAWLATDGLIDAREDGLNDQLDRNEDDQVRFEARLELIETRIRAQFTALDTLVSELSSTGDFLTSQLSQLANNNK
jgi:flagellar hook-associated protein 2